MSARAEVIAKAIRDNAPVDWSGPRLNQYARIWATAADQALSARAGHHYPCPRCGAEWGTHCIKTGTHATNQTGDAS
jgi:predicted RNA-binding Zn-ribbon protein involved in translation (DUF1610 family)